MPQAQEVGGSFVDAAAVIGKDAVKPFDVALEQHDRDLGIPQFGQQEVVILMRQHGDDAVDALPVHERIGVALARGIIVRVHQKQGIAEVVQNAFDARDVLGEQRQADIRHDAGHRAGRLASQSLREGMRHKLKLQNGFLDTMPSVRANIGNVVQHAGNRSQRNIVLFYRTLGWRHVMPI